MKRFLFLLLILASNLLYGQEKTAKKPEYVIVLGNEIISMQKIDEYANLGRLKSMVKGVSEEVRVELMKQFGEKIGEKEFIVLVTLFSEDEKIENDQKDARENAVKVEAQNDDGYILKKNDAAKDFTIELIDDRTLKLSELKGKVVLINFWATWCGPCLMEFYDIPSKIIEPYKNSDFVFVAISIGEKKAAVLKTISNLKEKGIQFNTGIDPEKTIWNMYATKNIPKNYLIDKQGVIRYVSTGNTEGNLERLSAAIKTLLEEKTETKY